MNFDVVQHYLDCPYKAMLSLTGREDLLNELAVFHIEANKMLSAIFSKAVLFDDPLKLNRHISVFEQGLLSGAQSITPKDLLIRKAIKSIRKLVSSIDKIDIDTIYGPKSYVLNIAHIETVELYTAGCIKVKAVKGIKSRYDFYVYDLFASKSTYSNTLKSQLLHNAILKDNSLDKALLSRSNIIFIDSYKNIQYTYKINSRNPAYSMNHIESICVGIKIGIFYASPSNAHCTTCIYKKTCHYFNHKDGLFEHNALPLAEMTERVSKSADMLNDIT